MITFTTESGSTYTISDDGNTVIRHPSPEGAQLAQDGETSGLVYLSPVDIGRAVVMILDIRRPSGSLTERITTPVVDVQVPRTAVHAVPMPGPSSTSPLDSWEF